LYFCLILGSFCSTDDTVGVAQKSCSNWIQTSSSDGKHRFGQDIKQTEFEIEHFK
jgi:hypothetical protein